MSELKSSGPAKIGSNWNDIYVPHIIHTYTHNVCVLIYKSVYFYTIIVTKILKRFKHPSIYLPQEFELFKLFNKVKSFKKKRKDIYGQFHIFLFTQMFLLSHLTNLEETDLTSLVAFW